MEKIIDNQEWCNCIFKHLLTHPNLHEQWNFNSVYFEKTEGKRPYKFSVSDLYTNMRKLIIEKNMTYSYKTMEIACFTNNEYRNAYGDEKSYDISIQEGIRELKDVLYNFYNSTEVLYQSISQEFIEEKTFELIKQQVPDYRLAYIMYKRYEAKEDDRRFQSYNDSFAEAQKIYPDPVSVKSVYTDIFDNDLRVKISDKLYQSMIYPLNNYLKGGFRKQTVTGFLTKTGGGKSTLMFTLAADALKCGYNVAFVNLEMNDYEVSTNILSALSKKFTHHDISNNITDDGFLKDLKEDVDMDSCGLFSLISNRGEYYTPTDMKWLKTQVAKAEQELSIKSGNPDFKFDFIIIDYLYLMTPVRHMNKTSRSDEMYRQIVIEAHEFSQNENYAVISVFQGNRGAEQKLANSESITMADVGDSYGAFKDIDFVFAISRVKEERDGILITPLKTRQYDGEWESIYVPYDFEHKRYMSHLAQIVENEEAAEEEEKPSKRKTTKRERVKPDFDIKDFLDVDSRLMGIPCGVIANTITRESRIKNRDYGHIVNEFDRRKWPVKILREMKNPNTEDMTNVIKTALAKLYGKDNSPKPIITPSLDIIDLAQKTNDLFNL